ASIAFSGGSTPKLLFAALAEQAIDWPAVQVTLVDERCVPPDHERSNARLLREFLLSKLPVQPVFLPLFEPGESSSERNARLQALAWPMDVAVLGMGGDGHTASFFPGARNLDALLDPQQPEKIMDTRSVPDDEPRVTWSLAALLEAQHLILHICGEDKARVLQTALEQLESGSAKAPYPIASLLQHTSQLNANDVPLDIYFSKNS
ncbi:MAG: 6-phosphogluconolactonase, partial [Pseudomonadales bacterium]|nr:6-phosphogluconolactonase [Pseudomonadales bacterium]